MAQLFANYALKTQGLPGGIVTGRDPKLLSAFWREIMTRLGIDLNMITTNHPEADGQMDSTHAQYLELFTQQNPEHGVISLLVQNVFIMRVPTHLLDAHPQH